ncbi:TetR/AcrR family transcriptional regulator [Priestia koreensis]|uniref:TetR/AcrR family transcriptional regulator n=1 Tax=Priestia koreensis TaxID=284581 RepID=UPI001F593274|nr:TetR/AcrR family transcriptional regulator [Priestia koreensis]MCM3004801.1 TetR/AcrR family transcriptional regulator [Priestia koreensis]UNL85600.1 TetR/AcrR family transcriptional regulator [Priestia koreensis]
MKKGEKRKQELVEGMASYILLNGIQSASLRNLAKATGTSDRMLLHYFKDKEELLTVVLSSISQKLILMLDNTEIEKTSFSSVVTYLYRMMKEPEVSPYMKLWLELIAMASKKEDPFYSIAREICNSFYEFYRDVIQIENGLSKEQMTALALVVVEGIALLEAMDCDHLILEAIEGTKNIK